MKIASKAFKAALAVSVAWLLLFPAISVSADSVIVEGDFSYVVNDDYSYMLYRYNGSETEPILPTQLNGKAVVGVYDNCFKNSAITSVTIPDSYVYIGDYAFYGSAITEIVLPTSLKTLGELAFNSCTSLTKLDFSKALSITAVPYALCQNASALKTVIFSEKINEIGERAFAFTGLETAIIPDSVKTIGEYAFYGCDLLESVKLSDDLTEIRNRTFMNCINLETIIIPASVKSLGDRAFEGCTSLESVKLPAGLDSIGIRTFYNAESLTTVVLPNNISSIGADAAAPMSYNNTLRVVVMKDSYANNYCTDNNFSNVYFKGDTNLDGKIDINDVTLIQKYKLGLKELSDFENVVSDVSGDDTVTLRDATLIQMKIAGIILSF